MDGLTEAIESHPIWTELRGPVNPYGAATRTDGGGSNGGTTQNPYLFHGGLQDRASGLIKYGQRWYDTTTGTWTQQDTLNTPLNPGNANRYTYVGDDPINHADPTGRDFGDFISDVANFAGAGAGFGILIGGGLGLLGGPFAPITVPGGAEAGALIGGGVGTIVGTIYGGFNDF